VTQPSSLESARPQGLSVIGGTRFRACELIVVEQRYRVVLEVLADGLAVTEVGNSCVTGTGSASPALPAQELAHLKRHEVVVLDRKGMRRMKAASGRGPIPWPDGVPSPNAKSTSCNAQGSLGNPFGKGGLMQ
jgi:hypothetical protein